ncbi:MAG: FecR family protein [Flavobacteriales bacterium]|nr:MAG: FecR family protein [Flavobacteriales bacterium]
MLTYYKDKARVVVFRIVIGVIMDNYIENIILKFFNDDCSSIELEELLDFILIEENYAIFKDYVNINHFATMTLNKFDKSSLINELETRIKKEKRTAKIKSYKQSLLLVAAVFICVFGLSYLADFNKIDTDSKNIILTTSSGQKVILDADEIQLKKLDGIVETKSNTLVYNKDENLETFVKNTIDVPYGKRFKLNLSDGTMVYLNSGSSFTYPVSFIDGIDREVFLSGEAFFDVSSDSLNTFKVVSTGSYVEVYGTKFNFKDYQEDNFSEVILTEGSLGVKNTISNSETIVLRPGDKAKVNYAGEGVEIKEVNTMLYTSWIDGRIIFRDENINNMITKLERIYDVIIINNNDKLNDEYINATILTETESIENVLDYLEEIYNLNYKIINNKIIIN